MRSAYFISGAAALWQFDAVVLEAPQQQRAIATSSMENSSPSMYFCLVNTGASWEVVAHVGTHLVHTALLRGLRGPRGG